MCIKSHLYSHILHVHWMWLCCILGAPQLCWDLSSVCSSADMFSILYWVVQPTSLCFKEYWIHVYSSFMVDVVTDNLLLYYVFFFYYTISFLVPFFGPNFLPRFLVSFLFPFPICFLVSFLFLALFFHCFYLPSFLTFFLFLFLAHFFSSFHLCSHYCILFPSQMFCSFPMCFLISLIVSVYYFHVPFLVSCFLVIFILPPSGRIKLKMWMLV